MKKIKTDEEKVLASGKKLAVLLVAMLGTMNDAALARPEVVTYWAAAAVSLVEMTKESARAAGVPEAIVTRYGTNTLAVIVDLLAAKVGRVRAKAAFSASTPTAGSA